MVFSWYFFFEHLALELIYQNLMIYLTKIQSLSGWSNQDLKHFNPTKYQFVFPLSFALCLMSMSRLRRMSYNFIPPLLQLESTLSETSVGEHFLTKVACRSLYITNMTDLGFESSMTMTHPTSKLGSFYMVWELFFIVFKHILALENQLYLMVGPMTPLLTPSPLSQRPKFATFY